MRPFISIIIPVYNVESTIARCLDSCINQSLHDIEIIIVDDCGSDSSIQIAQRYAKQDSRIHIVHNATNLGLFSTRIAGERVARGEYILPLDSDDYIALHTCKRLYRLVHNLADSTPLEQLTLLVNEKAHKNAIGGGQHIINQTGSYAMPPKVSIIIPTYNVESYIARCLESCINQTLHDIEILVIDDCGSDSSIQIAQDYAKQDCRIKIIHNKNNLGTFATRIVGIRQAVGEYIAFLDADDYLTNNACEISYNATQKSAQAPKTPSKSPSTQEQAPDTGPDIVFFGMRFEPRTFKRVSPPVLCKPLFGDEVLCEVFAHCATPPWHICAKLYKASHIRGAIEKLVAHMGENVRLTMAEDVLKSFWLTALAQKSIGIPDKLYVYCDSSSSITRKIDANTRDKKIADIGQVITELGKLSQVDCLRANASFSIAQQRAIAILTSVQVLEHRYDGLINGGWGGAVYIMACLKSLRYHRKWQTFVRLLGCIFSLGYVKL